MYSYISSFFLILSVLLAPVMSYSLSDSEYYALKRRSPEFESVEDSLAKLLRKIKVTTRHSGVYRSFFVPDQFQWDRFGRDEDASRYMREGMRREKAYIKATEKRIAFLQKELLRFQHEEDGRGDEPMCKRLTDREYDALFASSKIFKQSENVLKDAWFYLLKLSQDDPRFAGKIRADQRLWINKGRDIEACGHMQKGRPRDQAYAKTAQTRLYYYDRLIAEKIAQKAAASSEYSGIWLSDAAYAHALRMSGSLRNADTKLKVLVKELENSEYKNTVHTTQLQWVQKVRDEDAQKYLKMGYDIDASYIKAIEEQSTVLEKMRKKVKIKPEPKKKQEKQGKQEKRDIDDINRQLEEIDL